MSGPVAITEEEMRATALPLSAVITATPDVARAVAILLDEYCCYPEYFGTGRLKTRAHRCYEIAVKALIVRGTAPADSLLVHGTLGLTGIAHAWLVLPDGSIWDPVYALVFTPDEWWRCVQPRDEHRYTKYEAAVACSRAGHCGPWHE
jgi:hypothetical protein